MNRIASNHLMRFSRSLRPESSSASADGLLQQLAVAGLALPHCLRMIQACACSILRMSSTAKRTLLLFGPAGRVGLIVVGLGAGLDQAFVEVDIATGTCAGLRRVAHTLRQVDQRRQLKQRIARQAVVNLIRQYVQVTPEDLWIALDHTLRRAVFTASARAIAQVPRASIVGVRTGPSQWRIGGSIHPLSVTRRSPTGGKRC